MHSVVQKYWFTSSVSFPIKAAIDVTIEAEADVQALDALLNQQQHSFADFARQMWAYITVNQLLAER